MADMVLLTRLSHDVGFGVARFVQSTFTCVLLASLLTEPVNLLLNLLLPHPHRRTFTPLLVVTGWIHYRLHVLHRID